MHDLTQKEYQELLLEHNNFKHDIEDLQSRVSKCETQQEAINSLVRSVDRFSITLTNLVDGQKELKAEVKALKEAPAENYNHYKKLIIGCIITTVLGAVIGAIIALILKGGA